MNNTPNTRRQHPEPDGAPMSQEQVTAGWEPPRWEMENAWAEKQELRG